MVTNCNRGTHAVPTLAVSSNTKYFVDRNFNFGRQKPNTYRPYPQSVIRTVYGPKTGIYALLLVTVPVENKRKGKYTIEKGKNT